MQNVTLVHQEQVVTVDLHVTAACTQDCPYCWGPRGYPRPIDTTTARQIIQRLRAFGIRRVVFTGGDPLLRRDTSRLIRYAKELGLEVALSTTGDRLDEAFLQVCADCLDLVSLPLDGSCEAINARTKRRGHFEGVMRALKLLRRHPAIDVKLCTPVTRYNLYDVPNIVRLADDWAHRAPNRVFYNIFQVYPRAMRPVDWESLLVSNDEFEVLQDQIEGRFDVRVNFLPISTLDRLYVLIFPNGSLCVPTGPDYLFFGPFLELEDLTEALVRSRFDVGAHLSHSRGWARALRTV